MLTVYAKAYCRADADDFSGMYWVRTVTKIPRVIADDISPWWTTCQKRAMHSRGAANELERQAMCSMRGRHAAARRPDHPEAARPGDGLDRRQRSWAAPTPEALRVRRLPGGDGVRGQSGGARGGGTAPPGFLRSLQPGGRHAVDARGGRVV